MKTAGHAQSDVGAKRREMRRYWACPRVGRDVRVAGGDAAKSSQAGFDDKERKYQDFGGPGTRVQGKGLFPIRPKRCC